MIIFMIFSVSLSNVYAVPKSPEFANSNECWTKAGEGPGEFYSTCCWTVVDAEGIELDYCQTCEYDPSTKTHSGCSDVYPADRTIPGTGRLPPGSLDDMPTLEQAPSENEPPIKSDNSISPNEDSNVLDESQPTNPIFNSNKGTIIGENLAQDQPRQFSSNEEQSQESEESTETNNADSSSNSQENDDSSTSESTASLSKKGNTQNSPVPPECPTQGPIPPDCTMKPKF